MTTTEKGVFYTEKGAAELWESELETEKVAYLAMQEQIKLRKAILEQLVLLPDFYTDLLHTILLVLNNQIQQQPIDKEKMLLVIESLLEMKGKFVSRA
jgi:hypothetical protein